MKRYLNILALGVLVAFISCVKTDFDYGHGNNSSSDGAIHVFGAVEDFDIKHVGTRAGGEDISDSFISEMTMFVFKADGNLIQGYKTRNATFDTNGNLTAVNFDGCETCSSAINIQKANPTFLIDTEDGLFASFEGESQTLIYYDNFADDLKNCQIYIVANAYHQLKADLDNIKTLSQLEAVVLDIDETLSMPMIDESNYRGFPMIGTPKTVKFNLKKGDKNDDSVANIPLKKLYSKVRFTIQVCANQVVSGQIPTFEIEKVEVFNVPKKARLGRTIDPTSGFPIYSKTADDDYVTEMASGSVSTENINDYYHFTGTAPFVITDFNKTLTTHNPSIDQTDDRIEFGFYMPEHKVTPNTINYPKDIPESCYQYYKPLGVGATRDETGLVQMAKIATYARIHGTYTDHNGQIKTVRYDVYLGQDEVDDFTIKRNQQLNNQLVITGLTNYYNAYNDTDNISIDHRVAVDYKGFNLSMERTAILDSHFEVRPLDVELSPKSTMIITVPQEHRWWVAIESDTDARAHYDASVYVSDVKNKAVRKYFTNDLVSTLNGNGGNGGSITLTNSSESSTETYRVWLYIDENHDVYDKLLGEDPVRGGITESPTDGTYAVYGVKDTNPMYRICPLAFKFYGTDNDNTGGGAATVSKTATVNLQQWNLWRVWGGITGNRYYDIEHEEEYLNNYASDMEYGQTQDGMAWGLEGIQLSKNVMAYWAERHRVDVGGGLFAGIIEAIIDLLDAWLNVSGSASQIFKDSDKKPYYDFYLSRDNFPVERMDDDVEAEDYARDYKGIEFNREIATTLKASSDPKTKIDGVILTENPQSAFAYCYHKNKRNSSGVVVNQKWFLPAIDEIEDIALGAYEEFDEVFQNKEYWSCQPAYEYNTLIIHPYRKGGITGWGSSYTDMSEYVTYQGEFFNDNQKRARSTSVFANGVNTYTTIKSVLPAGVVSGKLDVNVYTNGGDKDGEVESNYSSNNINYNTDIYNTGEYRGNSARTEVCRIRAVYRSGIDTSKPAK